jgi:prolyl-tRNA synthetase
MEIGPKDLDKQHVALKRRDGGQKTFVPMAEVAAQMPTLLAAFQDELHAKAKAFREANSVRVETWAEMEKALDEQKFVYARWAGDAELSAKLREIQATVRCLPLDAASDPGPCILTGKPADRRILIAKAY